MCSLVHYQYVYVLFVFNLFQVWWLYLFPQSTLTLSNSKLLPFSVVIVSLVRLSVSQPPVDGTYLRKGWAIFNETSVLNDDDLDMYEQFTTTRKSEYSDCFRGRKQICLLGSSWLIYRFVGTAVTSDSASRIHLPEYEICRIWWWETTRTFVWSGCIVCPGKQHLKYRTTDI